MPAPVLLASHEWPSARTDGHTVHRDRFDAYAAALVAWLGDA